MKNLKIKYYIYGKNYYYEFEVNCKFNKVFVVVDKR